MAKKKLELTKKGKALLEQAGITSEPEMMLEDIGMNPFIPKTPLEKTPVPVQEEEVVDADYHDDEEESSFIDDIKALNPKDEPLIEAPTAYSNAVIGETMLSVCETLKQLSLHDVMLSWPRLIKDLVNEAYAEGFKNAKAGTNALNQ